MSWSHEEAVKALLMACKTLGWVVLVPNVHDDDDVEGLIVGTPQFCDERDDPGAFERWDTQDEGPEQ